MNLFQKYKDPLFTSAGWIHHIMKIFVCYGITSNSLYGKKHGQVANKNLKCKDIVKDLTLSRMKLLASTGIFTGESERHWAIAPSHGEVGDSDAEDLLASSVAEACSAVFIFWFVASVDIVGIKDVNNNETCQ